MVRREKTRLGDDVEVRQRGLDHDEIGAFLHVPELSPRQYAARCEERRTMARRASPRAVGGS